MLLELMAELQKMKREANVVLGAKSHRESKEHRRQTQGGLKNITP
jgi:hypothetical protein